MKLKYYIYARLATVLLSTASMAAMSVTEDYNFTAAGVSAASVSYRADGSSVSGEMQQFMTSRPAMVAESESVQNFRRGKGLVSGIKDLVTDAGKKIKSVFHREEAEDINVLTLDGGGMRGIGTLVMLSMLEMKTGLKTYQMFDRIYGTSTGGLAALMLARGLSATEVLDIYYDNLDTIFGRTWSQTLTNPLGLMGPAFKPDGLESVILKAAGHAKLSDSKVPVTVTTVNSKTHEVVLLSSDEEETRDVTLLEAGRATSAAPTYFPAKRIKTKSGEFMGMDGGVAVNNPSMVAYEHTKDIFKSQGKKVKINMLSLGTGAESRIQLDENAGKLGFGNPGNIPGFFMGIKAREIDDNMTKLAKKGKIARYGRFQFDLPNKIDLADISEEAKSEVARLGFERANQKDFNSFVEFMRKKTQNRLVSSM